MRPVSVSDGLVSAGFAAGVEDGSDPPEGDEEQAVSANARRMIEIVFSIMARNNTLSCYATVTLPVGLNLMGNCNGGHSSTKKVHPGVNLSIHSRAPHP